MSFRACALCSYIATLVFDTLWCIAPALRISEEESSAKGNASRDVPPSAIQGLAPTTTIPLYEKDKLSITADAYVSATINTFRLLDLLELDFDVNVEKLVVVEAPAAAITLLKATRGLEEKPLYSYIASEIAMEIWKVKVNTIDPLKKNFLAFARNLFCNSSTSPLRFVTYGVRLAMVETALEIVSETRIGFKRRGGDFSVILEVPWVSDNTQEELCVEMQKVGWHMVIYASPFLLAGLGLLWRFPRSAVAVLIAGAVINLPPVLGPGCRKFAWTTLYLPPAFERVVLPSDALGVIGMESIGFNSSLEPDMIRVQSDYISERAILNLVNTMASGVSSPVATVHELDLHMSFNGYTIQILPSTRAKAEIDVQGWQRIKNRWPAEVPNKCHCLHPVLFACPFKKRHCFFTLNFFFTGFVDTTNMATARAEVHRTYINWRGFSGTTYSDAPSEVKSMLLSGNLELKRETDQLFQFYVDSMQAKFAWLKGEVHKKLDNILTNSTTFSISMVPQMLTANAGVGVLQQFEYARLHFDTEERVTINDAKEKWVTVTAEIPNITPIVVQHVCEESARVEYQPMRMAPLIIISLVALVWQAKKTLAVLLIISAAISSKPVTMAACTKMGPSVVRNLGAGGYAVDLPTAANNVQGQMPLDKLGFPHQAQFHTSFKEDKFLVVFEPLPHSAFTALANEMFRNPVHGGKGKAGQGNVEIVMQGYRVDFTPNSFLTAAGSVVA